MSQEITRDRNNGGDSITIASSGTNSTSFFTGGYAWGRFTFPAALSGTTFHIETSVDNSTFVDAYDDSGTQMTLTPTVSTSHRIPDGAFPAEYMRLVSDSSEGAERTIEVTVSG